MEEFKIGQDVRYISDGKIYKIMGSKEKPLILKFSDTYPKNENDYAIVLNPVPLNADGNPFAPILSVKKEDLEIL